MEGGMKPRGRERASRVRRWIGRVVARVVAELQAVLRARRARRPRWKPVIRAAIEHADERTIRRMAEAERGGTSSRESWARYLRGENPGGLHHKAVRREGPEHPRPRLEEPQERKEKVPGGTRRIAVMRRGS
jgi:hypothetical protein